VARRLAIVAGAVVVALTVFGVFVRWRVDPEVVRAAVEQQASAALGQPVKVGDVEWALSARPTVVLTNVQIGSPAAITLNGSQIALPVPVALGGTTGTTSTPAGDAATGLTCVSIDRISLSDIDVAERSTHVTPDMESSLSGDRLAVSRRRPPLRARQAW
jgi:uncharacterized protein involved in outer membrane biogenesis